jgi:hypothetical protein
VEIKKKKKKKNHFFFKKNYFFNNVVEHFCFTEKNYALYFLSFVGLGGYCQFFDSLGRHCRK